MPGEPATLDVFISYSRHDVIFAARLEKALRAFRPPADLVDRAPARSGLAVFRDQSDIGVGDYDAVIERALAASRTLVVLCSPAARASAYVNDEIGRFVRLQPEGRLLPVLVEGLANNEAEPKDETLMAFPPALVQAMRMPLAVDYRHFDPARDKVDRGVFAGSWFQLLADVFGVTRHQIEQREKRRQQRRQRLIGGTVTGIVAVLSVALVLTLFARNEAVRQRDLAEQRRLVALARQLNVQADAASGDGAQGVQRALLLVVESLTAAWTVEGHELLLRLLDRMGGRSTVVDGLHRTAVLALAASPGMVATESQDLVLVREPHTWQTIRSLGPPAGGSLRAAAFSPDGRWLVAGCATHAACVWDTRSWHVAKPLDIGIVLRSAAFSADGRMLATVVVGRQQVLRYDTRDWTALSPVDVGEEGHTDVTGAAFTADGRFLVVKGRRRIHWWDLKAGRVAARTEGHDDWSFALDGLSARVVTQDPDRRLQLVLPTPGAGGALGIETQPGPWPHRLADRPTPVFSADGTKLAVQTTDDMVVVLDPTGRLEPLVVGGAISLAFSSDGRTLMGGQLDGKVRMTALTQPERISIPVPAAAIDVALNPDGTHLAWLDKAGALQVHDTRDGRQLAATRVDTDARSLHFSRNGKWLLALGDRDLHVFDTAQWQERVRHHGEESLRWVAMLPQERWLAIGEGRRLRRFDTDGWREAPAIELEQLEEEVFASADGRRMATRTGPSWSRGLGLTHPSVTSVWDTATGAQIGWQSHEADDIANMSGLTWSRRAADATGEWTRTASAGDTATVVSALSWPELQTVADQQAAPDWPWLTSVNAKGTPLWRAAVSRAARAHDDPDAKPAFSANGRWLATRGKDGTLRLWPLGVADLIGDACARVLRNLTPEEWKASFGDEPVRATCPNQPPTATPASTASR